MNYETPSQPHQIRLDSCTFCNAKCLSCHRFLSERKGKMELDMVSDIIRDIQTWPEPLIEMVPVNYGEVFLHPQYHVLLRMIALGLPQTALVIPTNGVLMDVEFIASLRTLHVVNMSINGGFEDTYEQFMGLKADFGALHTKIRKLHALRPDVTVWASMVFDPMYQSDLERDTFIAAWRDIAVPQILPAASAGRPDKTPKILRTRPCRSIFSDFVIGFDGKLSSCCWDADFRLSLGDWSGNLLQDWRNPLLEELRQKHNEGRRQEVEFCRLCTFE